MFSTIVQGGHQVQIVVLSLLSHRKLHEALDYKSQLTQDSCPLVILILIVNILKLANLPSRDNTLIWLDEQMDRWESVKFDRGTKNIVREALKHVRDTCPTFDHPDSNSRPPLPPSPTQRQQQCVDEIQSDEPSNVHHGEAAQRATGAVGSVVDGAGAASGGNVSLVDEEFLNILSQLALGEVRGVISYHLDNGGDDDGDGDATLNLD